VSAVKTGRHLAGALVCVALMAGLLTGCTSVRSSLGTSDSSCYLALPTSSSAVDGHGRLLGVHLFTMAELHHKSPHLYKVLAARHAVKSDVCVAAFSGTFTKASVSKPIGSSAGRLAIVISQTGSNHLIGTVIVAHPPFRLGHPHIG
jgi:hypothetical protein